MSIQAILPDEELDRLETLLDDPALPEALRLDQIQGYLCAALAGPRATDEEEWLSIILGGDEAADTEAGRGAAHILRRLAAALHDELLRGEPPVLLLYPKDDNEDAPSDYAPWCEAYLMGVDGAPDDWFDDLGEDEDGADEAEYLDERLFPLMLLTGEAENAAREHGEQWPEGKELEEMIAAAEEDLPQAVTDVFRFWAAKRGAGTVKREAPKVGRNDPCPCGSGKKFKQCCGAETD